MLDAAMTHNGNGNAKLRARPLGKARWKDQLRLMAVGAYRLPTFSPQVRIDRFPWRRRPAGPLTEPTFFTAVKAVNDGSAGPGAA